MVAAGERFDEAGGVRWPCIESAANCRPAIQPSVRFSKAAMFSAERFRPITRLRNSAASAGVNRKIGGAQFGQLAADAEPGQGELGIFSGGDDQLHLRRQVIDKKVNTWSTG